MKIIFATQNKGKSAEVKAIFSGTKFEIFSLYDLGNNIEVEESGDTFRENAFLKAKAVFDIYKVPVVSDDSGLIINQLNGRPGIFSARYAGENCTYLDNNLKVMDELKQFPEPHIAKFISYAVYFDGEKEIEAVGELPGKIIMDLRGKNGFGYDPIFIPDGYEQTISEMDFNLKNKISHRAASFNQLKIKLLKL